MMFTFFFMLMLKTALASDVEAEIDINTFRCSKREEKEVVVATVERAVSLPMEKGVPISPRNYAGSEILLNAPELIWTSNPKHQWRKASVQIAMDCPGLNLDHFCGYDVMPLLPKGGEKYLFFLSTSKGRPREVEGYLPISELKGGIASIRSMDWSKCVAGAESKRRSKPVNFSW